MRVLEDFMCIEVMGCAAHATSHSSLRNNQANTHCDANFAKMMSKYALNESDLETMFRLKKTASPYPQINWDELVLTTLADIPDDSSQKSAKPLFRVLRRFIGGHSSYQALRSPLVDIDENHKFNGFAAPQ